MSAPIEETGTGWPFVVGPVVDGRPGDAPTRRYRADPSAASMADWGAKLGVASVDSAFGAGAAAKLDQAWGIADPQARWAYLSTHLLKTTHPWDLHTKLFEENYKGNLFSRFCVLLRRLCNLLLIFLIVCACVRACVYVCVYLSVCLPVCMCPLHFRLACQWPPTAYVDPECGRGGHQ